ncbi:MAG: hypothetical protein WA109_09855 [Bellilinea sp.]
MNDQLYRSPVNTPEFVEETDKDTNNPVVTSDPFADNVPVDEALMHETPMGGTVASVGPLNETILAEIPLFETPDLEIPMGGTVAAVGPMDETIVPAAPMDTTIPYKTTVGESYADEAVVSNSILYEDPMDEILANEDPAITPAG